MAQDPDPVLLPLRGAARGPDPMAQRTPDPALLPLGGAAWGPAPNLHGGLDPHSGLEAIKTTIFYAARTQGRYFGHGKAPAGAPTHTLYF